ncbi:MAG TPA: 3-hydroxyacyl-CoA dehydrogenase NAD-binding domain-containing protein, partial [Rectinema sp.]|nr:3-hydroxyacyl-CoA dehydrogenase NAD-binding domain-containing protein [Rectinema sp.]
MEMKDIKKVLIVGAGTMGQQIAFQCAAHGYKVILYDMNEAALVVAQQRLTAYANDLIAGGYLERAVAEKAFAQIATTTDEAEAAREADLLS